jgi:RNA polymerase-binding protein DksA
VSALDTAEFRRLLEEQRAAVVAAIEYLHRENPGSMSDELNVVSPDNHMAETASVTIDREIDYTLEENEEEVLAAIDAALARIEEGTYGRCQRCGQQVAGERLRALPYATLCIDCKRKDERG